MSKKRIYLDHNASAPLLPEARAAMLSAMDLVGNPSAVHADGRVLRKNVDDARTAIAKAAGAQRTQLVFTGTATEAITQAICGASRAFKLDRIIVSAGDHAAVLKAAEMTGLPVTRLGLLANGQVDLDALDEILAQLEDDGQMALFGCHWVNNETGVIQPVEQIEMRIGPTRHLLFIDAVQAFAKLPLDFAARATDMMAISGHKIGGPAGIGGLLLKGHCDEVRLIPGGGQETGRRGGTEAHIAIAGFGAAAEHFGTHYALANVDALTQRLEAGLKSIAPEIVVFGTNRLGNVTDFAVPGLKSAVAMMALDLDGVSVSSGSACSSGKVGRSHVLTAMGVEAELADCALRISLGWSSQSTDIEIFLAALERIVARRAANNGRAA